MKITKKDKPNGRDQVSIKTKEAMKPQGAQKWWLARAKEDRCQQLLATAAWLKEQQQYRYRQASMFSRLYGNQPMYGIMGTTAFGNTNQQLPLDRPTMNVIQSCVDTLVARVTQDRPSPKFLTDAGNYKERNEAKKLNQFLGGEFYQTDMYSKAKTMLRDACVLGTGCLKVYKEDNKVRLARTLLTELLVDEADGRDGDPRQLIQTALVDRGVLLAAFPEKKSIIEKAEQAYYSQGADASKTMSDQVMVIEGWHLPSGKDAGDGLHMICLTSGDLLEAEWESPRFPFVFLHYSPRLMGFWGQGLAEQLMGTQMEINKLLMTISASINLVGVPRVFVQDGSKVVKSHLNNQIGAIVTYQGTKPEYEVAPCVPQEIYMQLQRLIDYAYQQSGISQLAATSKKPGGLDSGAALREYDDMQSDRFSELESRYDEMFVHAAHLIMGEAVEIAKETGKYQTIYPNKDGTREIDLPKVPDLLENPFVIQCFNASALPKDPAGRLQKVVDMIQAGMLTLAEGRRLLDFPDLDQVEKLANASEERILQCLDKIVDEGKYTPPDSFMDLELATQLSIQYYNLYVSAKLEEDRAEMLRDFNDQCQGLLNQAKAAMAPPAPAPGGPQLAVAEPLPTSPMIPQGQVA